LRIINSNIIILNIVKLKIAVNTRLLLAGRLDGIGRFADESLRIITRQHPEHTFYFYFDRKPNDCFLYNSNIIPVVLHPQARHPLLFLTWFEASLPLHFIRTKPDIFLSIDGFLSLTTSVKSVGVIHDLNFEHFPEDIPFLVRKYYTTMFPRFVQKASRIATVSEYSKSDIIDKYHVDASKIDIVYNGAGNIFKPIPATVQQHTRIKFSKGFEFFFFVGTLHPRKNLVNLFKAFDLFKKSDTKSIKLVVAGARMWWTEEIRLAYEEMEYRDDVIFTGRISDQDLAALIASALALTYVSYFEGFGIPILEAFQCDTPVITSNITSMPEVAGKAAILTDPFSITSISEAMQKIASDSDFRQKLIEAGREQRQKFSWEQTATKLWGCIEKAVE
jgi:glycosyltransferase involved in cell wall biosynthesis